jgi:hypothetical protein
MVCRTASRAKCRFRTRFAMRLAGLVAIPFGSVVAPTAAVAQIADCDASMQPGFVASEDTHLLYFYGVAPTAPDSATPIHVDTGRIAFFTQSIATQVRGHEIDLVVTGRYNDIGVPPPLQCISTTIGPLPAGSYTVNATFEDPDFPGGDSAPPVTITVVGGGIAPAPIATPTLSTVMMAVLIGLVCAIGFRTSRKRARG